MLLLNTTGSEINCYFINTTGSESSYYCINTTDLTPIC